MFRTVPLSIITSFSLYTQQWYVSYSLRAGSGRSSVLILLASCQQTTMTYTTAVCTVKKLLMMDRGTVRNMSVPILLASCQQTCIACTIGVCTVKKS